MKAEITIRISHSVSESGIPPKTFMRSSDLQLDLPLGTSEFTEAVEMLLMNNVMPVTHSLCDKVTKAIANYVAEVKKSGLCQMELPLKDETSG